MTFGQQNDLKPKSASLIVSLAFHAAAFLFFVGLPGVELPHAAESEYKLAIRGNEDKIVWYKFRKELPAVTPTRAPTDQHQLRAESLARQAIVSAPKEAPKRDQMVWTPAPESVPKPIDSANLLAIRLPERAFTPPPPGPAAPRTAPQLAADAPQLQAQAPPLNNLPATALPPKAFTAPPTPARPVTAVSPLADAPQLAANVLPGGASVPASKLPPRPFAAPTGGGKTAARSVSVDEPAPPTAIANSRDLNVAIVGLNPIDRLGPPPTASSPAAFSSGEKLNPKGAASEGAGTGLSVPDLFVRGPRDAKPDLLAQAHLAPTSSENLRAAMRAGEPVLTTRVAPAPSTHGPEATKVSGAPDARFNGRDVFMMAIQMPNLTSYSGSWLMWYSDHTAREAGLAPIAAPVAHRKIDPKYVATAVEERVEGNVTLGCVIDQAGNVSGVEIIRGIDDRLNQSAREALAKWEFYPATRDGSPVAVDVLVQIPFRLAPKIPSR